MFDHQKNMSCFHYVISHFSYFHSFLTYRKSFKNYFYVTVCILKKKYPFVAIMRNGKKITIHSQGDVYATARLKTKKYELNEDGIYHIQFNNKFSNIILDTHKKIDAGIYVPFFSDAWLQSKMNERTVLDIGAWIADTSISFVAHGAKRIIALEPLLENYNLAKKNIENNNFNSKITLLLAACGKKNGFIYTDPTIESSIRAGLKTKAGGIKIPTITLEKIVNEYNIEDGILKMNCEGCEYDTILNTKNEVLRKFEYIVIEYHYGYKNITKKLMDAGYKIELKERPVFAVNSNANPKWMYIGKIIAERLTIDTASDAVVSADISNKKIDKEIIDTMNQNEIKKELKILFPFHASPSLNTFQTISMRNILEEFQKEFNSKLFWFIYTPEGIEIVEQKKNEYILQIQDFRNAVDLLKQIKPDVIFAHASPGQIHYSISLAAKSLGIPTIGDFTDFTGAKNEQTKSLIKNYAKQFFEQNIPGESRDSEKKIMKRGRFFNYKTLFLIRTLLKLDINIFSIIKLLIKTSVFYLSHTHSRSPDYVNTLNWVETEKLEHELINLGFPKSSLFVSGNPVYDKSFLKISNFQKTLSEKIRVLLVTSPIVEHGYISKIKRDETVKKICNVLKTHKNKIDFQIKIHGIENLKEYQSLILKSDPSIKVHQDGDLLDFLGMSDVLIFYSSKTTAAIFALLAEKPIIIIPFSDSDIFFKKNLAVKAEIDNLSDIIFNILKLNIPNKIDKQNFIKEYLYKFDGKASERIVYAISNLLTKQNL